MWAKPIEYRIIKRLMLGDVETSLLGVVNDASNSNIPLAKKQE